jgi:hypothetical protein
MKRLKSLKKNGQSFLLISPAHETAYRETTRISSDIIKPLPLPTDPIIGQAQLLIRNAARAIPSLLKAQCYRSLLTFDAMTTKADPLLLVPELNDFAVKTLLYDAQDDGGKTGQPPAITPGQAQKRPLEDFGARVMVTKRQKKYRR